MIHPFAKEQVRVVERNGDLQAAISFGVSSYGYDMRLGNQFRILRPHAGQELDPKNTNVEAFEPVTANEYLLLPPQTLVLGQTVEYFKIPRDILTICFGKSTYARCGVFVNVTPFEPEWEGYVTLEFSNTTPLPAKIYANEGVAQVVFFESDPDDVCETSYRDRGGKYQGQQGVTLPKI